MSDCGEKGEEEKSHHFDFSNLIGENSSNSSSLSDFESTLSDEQVFPVYWPKSSQSDARQLGIR